MNSIHMLHLFVLRDWPHMGDSKSSIKSKIYDAYGKQLIHECWFWCLYAEENFLFAVQWLEHSICTVADEHNTPTARGCIQIAYDRKCISTFVLQLWSFLLLRGQNESVRILDNIQKGTSFAVCWSR